MGAFFPDNDKPTTPYAQRMRIARYLQRCSGYPDSWWTEDRRKDAADKFIRLCYRYDADLELPTIIDIAKWTSEGRGLLNHPILEG